MPKRVPCTVRATAPSSQPCDTPGLVPHLITPRTFIGLGRTIYGAALILYLVVAEVAAVTPVLHGEAARGNPLVVQSAIIGGLAGIAVLALMGWAVPLVTPEEENEADGGEDDSYDDPRDTDDS